MTGAHPCPPALTLTRFKMAVAEVKSGPSRKALPKSKALLRKNLRSAIGAARPYRQPTLTLVRQKRVLAEIKSSPPHQPLPKSKALLTRKIYHNQRKAAAFLSPRLCAAVGRGIIDWASRQERDSDLWRPPKFRRRSQRRFG